MNIPHSITQEPLVPDNLFDVIKYIFMDVGGWCAPPLLPLHQKRVRVYGFKAAGVDAKM